MKRTNKITFLIGLGAISSDTVREAALTMLAQRFGGFTADDVTGGWIDLATGELVVEDSLRVVVYQVNDPVNGAAPIEEFAIETGKTLAAMFAQKCILVAFEYAAVSYPEGV